MQILSYFNPFSDQHHALEDSKKLSDAQHALVWLASILVGSVTLGVGGVALFRTLVGRAKSEVPKKEEVVVVKTQRVYDYVKTKPLALQLIFRQYRLNSRELELISKVPLDTWNEYYSFLRKTSEEGEPPVITEKLIQGFIENLNSSERKELVALLERALEAHSRSRILANLKNPPAKPSRDSKQDMEQVD